MSWEIVQMVNGITDPNAVLKSWAGLMLGQRYRRCPNIKPTQRMHCISVVQITKTANTSRRLNVVLMLATVFNGDPALSHH